MKLRPIKQFIVQMTGKIITKDLIGNRRDTSAECLYQRFFDDALTVLNIHYMNMRTLHFSYDERRVCCNNGYGTSSLKYSV
ncbi:hypothetical protein A1348_29755 [Pseudomonas protegens]|nr:hypothetical protein A1348_29755 [Pseudomonas protegens]